MCSKHQTLPAYLHPSFRSLPGAEITGVNYHAPIRTVNLISWFCTFELICVRYEGFLELKIKFYSDKVLRSPGYPPNPYR